MPKNEDPDLDWKTANYTVSCPDDDYDIPIIVDLELLRIEILKRNVKKVQEIISCDGLKDWSDHYNALKWALPCIPLIKAGAYDFEIVKAIMLTKPPRQEMSDPKKYRDQYLNLFGELETYQPADALKISQALALIQSESNATTVTVVQPSENKNTHPFFKTAKKRIQTADTSEEISQKSDLVNMAEKFLVRYDQAWKNLTGYTYLKKTEIVSEELIAFACELDTLLYMPIYRSKPSSGELDRKIQHLIDNFLIHNPEHSQAKKSFALLFDWEIITDEEDRCPFPKF